MKKQTNYVIGHFVEKVALLWLCLKGYHLIKMNYITGKGTGAGEVDLIMSKNKTLIFIEVKKRQNLITAAEAITQKNKARIIRASQAFLRNHPQYQFYKIRYDAVLFYPHHLPKHIVNAWHL